MNRYGRLKDATYLKLINSARWKHLRHQVLKVHPLCERCLSIGRTSAAEEVHHITPIETAITDADKERLAFNVDNLQALCNKCHVLVHTRLRSKTKEEIKRRQTEILKNFEEKFLK